MQKVLLVAPAFANDIWAVFKEMPLGLSYIASSLKHKGFEVRGVDYNVERFSNEHFENILSEFSPDLIGLTGTYGTIQNMIEIAVCAKNNLNVPVVLGGLVGTFLYKEIFEKCNAIDIFVHGEGEETICELLSGIALSKINGISYREGSRLIKTKRRSVTENLDAFCDPDRTIFDASKYKMSFKKNYTTLIESTRGCPYDCDFCTQAKKEGRVVRFRSAQRVVNEIREISKHERIANVAFVDNDFLVNRKNAEEILDGIIENELNERFSFHIGTRVDHLIKGGDSLLLKLKQANIKTIFVGIESMAPQQVANIGKVRNPDAVISLEKKYAKLNIEFLPSYIIGYPGETREDIRCTLKFAKRLNTKSFMVGILTPYPGTSIYDDYLSRGMISSFEYFQYDNNRQVVLHDLDLRRELQRFRRAYFLRWSYLNIKSLRSFNIFNLRRFLVLGYYLLHEVGCLIKVKHS